MLPKLWERSAFRIIIYILCAALVAGAFGVAVVGFARYDESRTSTASDIYFHPGDILSKEEFTETEAFRGTAFSKWDTLITLYSYVTDTDSIDFDAAVESEIRSIYENMRNDIEYRLSAGAYSEYSEYSEYESQSYLWSGYWSGIGETPYVIPQEFSEEKMIGDTRLMKNDRELYSFEEPGVREAFEELFPEQLAYIEDIIETSLRKNFEAEKEKLDGLLYFAGDGERSFSNVNLGKDGYPVDAEAFTDLPAYLKYEEGKSSSDPEMDTDEGFWVGGAESSTAILAWPEDILADYERQYTELSSIFRAYFFAALIMLVCAIVLFIILLVFTGRKRPAYENTRKLWKLDEIFVEIQIILLFIVIVAAIGFLIEGLSDSVIRMLANNRIYLGLACAAVFVTFALIVWFVTSLVRIGKADLFAKRSLIARLITGPIKALGEAIRSGYDGSNPLAKTMIPLILFWVLTAVFAGLCALSLNSYAPFLLFVFGVLLILTLVGALYITYKWIKRYGRLRKGVEEIAGGNLDYRIEIQGDGKNEFDRLSARINEIGHAQDLAVQSELKNQRLKTDLISNVSHDLKTPLTSILTYTDLLKKEGLKSKRAEEYLAIIEEKGWRLQKLTEDLFDAAKASSGAIAVRKEKVDLLALLKQEIAEMNGGFTEVAIELVIDANEEHYYVEADSQLLWRVVDNLLNNVRKYTQPGTRVYIELKERKEREQAGESYPVLTTLAIKNISAAKLNIPPDELMERFKRGDESRTTEGSGLGLSIARDLVRLQNGRFEIFIDGDLFKVVVMLPPYKDE